jgi:LacI family transcriptional regulator
MPNIYDVARMAGVSTTTVSHVLNATRHVNEDTRNRVLAAVEQLRFQPSSVARAMVRQETKTIALIVPDNLHPFFSELAYSIEAYAFAAGYNVILCQSERNPAKENAYLDMLVSKRVDGVLHMTTDHLDPHLEPLLAHNIPVATFDRDYADSGLRIDCVTIENEHGGYLATKHLVDLGHRRLACIWVPGGKSYLRLHGFQRALQEASLAVDPALLLQGDWSLDSGWRAAEQLLAQADPPTAIFASNDLMAIGAMACLHEHGCRVPQQISVVGYDDISLARYSSPLLTTYATPINEVGARLCQLLFDRIDEKLPAERQQVFVHGELKIRKSAAPPPAITALPELPARGPATPPH